MPRLRMRYAVIAPFPLPLLAERYYIIAKVDELMSFCDQLQASLAIRDYINCRLLDDLLHRSLIIGGDEKTYA